MKLPVENNPHRLKECITELHSVCSFIKNQFFFHHAPENICKENNLFLKHYFLFFAQNNTRAK